MADVDEVLPSAWMRPLAVVPAIIGSALFVLGGSIDWDPSTLMLAWTFLGFSMGTVASGLSLKRRSRKRDRGDSSLARRHRARRPTFTAVTESTGITVTADELNDLELRAKVRGDFETAGLVDRLQPIQVRLRQLDNDVDGEGQLLVMKLYRLFNSSAESLERALALHLAAREMVTEEGKQKVADQRKQLVSEVATAVGQTEQAIDRLRAGAAVAGDSDRAESLADLSGDLDRQLEVARKVEARMAELEARARGDYSASEAFITGEKS